MKSKDSDSYKPASWEKITFVIVSISIIITALFITIRNEPFADSNLVVIFRIMLSVAAAALGATIPGFLYVDLKSKGILIRAGGALALFVLTYLLTPSVIPQVTTIKQKFNISALSMSGNKLRDVDFYDDASCLKKIDAPFSDESQSYTMMVNVAVGGEKILSAKKINYKCTSFEVKQDNNTSSMTLVYDCNINPDDYECKYSEENKK